MVSLIIDTEKHSVFHIDADPKWVQKEFEGFHQANPDRYRLFSIRRPDQLLIAAAADGKLIVPKTSRNPYIPVERRAPKERLETLESACLIAKSVDGEGYRLTRYGESAALVINEPQVAAPETPPITLPNRVLFTVGGNDTKYLRDLKKIKDANIPAQRLGNVNAGSNYKQVSVAPEHVEAMLALGFIKSKRQS